MLPASTGSGLSDFRILRSAIALTVVFSVAVLFDGSGSVVVDDTVAEFVMMPVVPESTVTVIVYDAEPPAIIVPREQVGTPFGSLRHPVVDTKVTPAGSVSDTWTFCASDGPALLTVTV